MAGRVKGQTLELHSCLPLGLTHNVVHHFQSRAQSKIFSNRGGLSKRVPLDHPENEYDTRDHEFLPRPVPSTPPLGAAVILGRLWNSTVIWSWGFNTLRLATGLILLPLVLSKFSATDYGMYIVFLTLVRFVPIIDFGFAPTIGRFVSYAYGGAETLQARGVQKSSETGSPNYALLWNLLYTTRRLYRYMTLIILVILGTWGTFTAESNIHETTSVLVTRLAWLTTLAATLLDIYWNWWIT